MNEEKLRTEFINLYDYLVDELSKAIKERDLNRITLIVKTLELVNDITSFVFNLNQNERKI